MNTARARLEFKVNDFVSELNSAPAPMKVFAAVVVFGAGAATALHFPLLAIALYFGALLFVAGWTLGTE